MHRLRVIRAPLMRTALLAYACVGALGVACSQPSDRDAARTVTTAGAGVVEEARAFMDAYARDLLAGDRAAVGARYDRSGAYFLGNGRKEFMPYDSIVAQYAAASWTPPASFAWRDLSFEPAGPDAVVVAGQFVWGAAPGSPSLTMSYTALLHRQDGALRIRVENESFDPSTLPPRPASDSARK